MVSADPDIKTSAEMESDLDTNINIKEEPISQPLSSIKNDEHEVLFIISPEKNKQTIIFDDKDEDEESKFAYYCQYHIFL